MALSSSFWIEQSEILYEILFPLLLEGVQAGVEGGAQYFDQDVRLGTNWQQVNTWVRDYVRYFTQDEVAKITNTSMAGFISEFETWQKEGLPLSELVKRLHPYYGESRAQMIAVTEVTRAYAEGNLQYWQCCPIDVPKYAVQNSEDEAVCPLCGAEAAGGPYEHTLRDHVPPFHVCCRCWLRPVLKDGSMPKPRPVTDIPFDEQPDYLPDGAPSPRRIQQEMEQVRERYEQSLAELREAGGATAARLGQLNEDMLAMSEMLRNIEDPDSPEAMDLLNQIGSMKDMLLRTLQQDIAIKEKYDMIQLEARRSLVSRLGPQRTWLGDMEVNISQDLLDRDSFAQEKLDSALGFYNSMLGEAWDRKLSSNKRQFSVQYEMFRAYFSPDTTDVYLSPVNGSSVYVHEIGHRFEYLGSGGLSKAKEFLAGRTYQEDLVELRKIYPSWGFDDWETTRPDRFFHAYCGKEYPNATEVVSMGVEALFEEPVEFYKRDPDYFNFILDFLYGRFADG